jgi:hypothetical protein
MDETRLYAPGLFAGPAPAPAVQPRPAPPQQPHPTPMQSPAGAVPRTGVADGRAPVPGFQPQPQPQRRAGAFRRFMHALWELTVTTTAIALFAGAWALAIYGVAEERRRWMQAGVAATVLFTPFAVHRLSTRRGRYGFAVFGALVATLVGWRVVGRGTDDPAIGLAAVFGLQVLACFLMSWLTRRREPDPYPES